MPHLRPFHAILLPLLTLSLALTPMTVVAGRPSLSTASVQPLQHEGRTFCTAWSINEREGLWATAGHCAEAIIDNNWVEGVMVDGKPAFLVYVDAAVDVAVVQSLRREKALKVASESLQLGDRVSVQGYPYGLPQRITTHGQLAARNVVLQHPSMGMLQMHDIYDITIAAGNSGSPIFNEKGEVVGLAWGGFDSMHAIGVPLESLQRALWMYWR